MQCPQCGSENTQRLSIAYENGTHAIHTRSHSVGAGFGASAAAGGATTVTSGTSTTLLAARAAPPAKKRYRHAFILPVVLWFAAMFFEHRLIGTILNIAAYGVLAIALYYTFQFNSKQWPPLFRQWQAKWICHKCGTIYSHE